MALQEKYKSLIDSAGAHHVTSLAVTEQDGKLKLKGTARHPQDRDAFWTALKGHAGWEQEVAADIAVADESIYGYHEVKSGDTLSKIAKAYLGDANAYPKIFDINRDQLSDPDKIQVGQKLKLPARG